MSVKVIQIDPVGCGCTECLIGMYVPLQQASWGQVARMLLGKLSDATSEEFYQKDQGIVAKHSKLFWARYAALPKRLGS